MRLSSYLGHEVGQHIGGMKLLAFSDLHRNRRQAERLVSLSREADIVVGAGDFATWHVGLARTVGTFASVAVPIVFVPGNNESAAGLSRACAGLPHARVLHGNATEIDGVTLFGLGAAVPPTPLPWSFDLAEDDARGLLSGCPEGAVLISHSPPKGCLDEGHRPGMGSAAVRETIERKRPSLVICGHIHQQAGRQATLAGARVVNAGPKGLLLEL
jgi:uncharacterized protein